MSTENQDNAGLPIPPPALMTIFLIVALIFGLVLPLPLPAPWWIKVSGGLILIAGFLFASSAVRSMIKEGNSPDPRTSVKKVVTQGPYQYSRNPIYLGLVTVVIGIPLIFGYYWGALLSPIVVDAFNRFIIIREETYLERKFGQDYLNYKSKVRRWL